MDSEMKDIRLEDLVPFKGHTGQAYKVLSEFYEYAYRR